MNKTILLLAANPIAPDPTKTVYLQLQEEEREIKERLRLAGYGKTPIYSAVAARPRDIQQALVDFNPQIVHFSGHGAGQEGLVFEDSSGREKLVTSDALAGLFKLFSEQLECVVLNACYSEAQSHAISEHIKYVIGMSKAIGDKAAIEFSVGFYTALGAGRSYEFAYNLGCNAIHLSGFAGQSIPVLVNQIDSHKAINQPSFIKEENKNDLYKSQVSRQGTGIEITCLKQLYSLIPGYTIICEIKSSENRTQIELKMGETKFIDLQPEIQYQVRCVLSHKAVPYFIANLAPEAWKKSLQPVEAAYVLKNDETIKLIYETPATSDDLARLTKVRDDY